MKITVVFVGSVREKYLKDAVAEYTKRLSKYTKLDLISVPDEAICDNPSEKEISRIKEKEGEKILRVLPENSYKIALNLKGTMLSSEELAEKMNTIFSYHNAHIAFIIGGSLGLGENVLNRMDYHLCFSKMTFPHQLMQVILLEQLYRAFKINHNETYHK